MSIRTALYRSYLWLQRRIAPGLEYSQTAYERELARRVGPQTRWLDIGCGHQVLPSWRADAERELVGRAALVVGTDYDLSSLAKHRTISYVCRADATTLPFPDACFDLVTANMVVEHLQHPRDSFAELRRVLRPGGHFVFHTPNARGYATQLARLVPEAIKGRLVRLLDGRPSDDVFPTFYRANTAEQIQTVAAAVGFEVEEVRPITTDAILQMIPPLAALELLWIRKLMRPEASRLRPDLIAALRRI
jgi:ubiquinone/menaquinone biosynthesis C-methylase UbiE